MRNHLTDRTDLGYTICIVNQKRTQMIINRNEYIINTSTKELTEIRTGIVYTSSTTVLRELIDTNVSYKKLMMEGLIIRK